MKNKINYILNKKKSLKLQMMIMKKKKKKILSLVFIKISKFNCLDLFKNELKQYLQQNLTELEQVTCKQLNSFYSCMIHLQ